MSNFTGWCLMNLSASLRVTCTFNTLRGSRKLFTRVSEISCSWPEVFFFFCKEISATAIKSLASIKLYICKFNTEKCEYRNEQHDTSLFRFYNERHMNRNDHCTWNPIENNQHFTLQFSVELCHTQVKCVGVYFGRIGRVWFPYQNSTGQTI